VKFQDWPHMSKETKLIPELRFPEFLNKGQWTKTRLADFNNVESGDGDWILSKDISPNGEYRIVQLSSIGFGGFKEKTLKTITIEKFGELNGTPIKKGDLLINRMVDSDKINSCIFPYDGKYVTSVDVCWIRLNQAFNNYFMMSLICTGSNQRNLLSLSSGAGRVRISKTNLFEKFVFPFPKVPEEQQKIASCLSSLDELIAAHNDKLDALKDHKKGLLQNLFPQEGETVPKVRFPEFENKEWNVSPIDDYCEVFRGSTFSKSDITEDGSEPCIHYGELFTKYNEVISKVYSRTDKQDGFKSEAGDVLMPSSDVTPDGLARASAITLGNVILGGDMNILRPYKGTNSIFLSYLLNHSKREIIKLVSGTTVKHIYPSQIITCELPVIDNEAEQQKIASCLSAVDELITAQLEKIEQLQQHKKGLMQGLFPKIER